VPVSARADPPPPSTRLFHRHGARGGRRRPRPRLRPWRTSGTRPDRRTRPPDECRGPMGSLCSTYHCRQISAWPRGLRVTALAGALSPAFRASLILPRPAVYPGGNEAPSD
jgi:hypothetical protein